MITVKSYSEITDRLIGKGFKSMREQMGISQTDLAKKLKVKSYGTIASWETGKTPIPTAAWLRVEWLLTNNVT